MKYYRDAEGNYLGGWDQDPPEAAVEVPFPPGDARQKWDLVSGTWLPLPPQPYSLPVSIFWLRMSDDEGDAFDTAMNSASPIRLRRAFRAAQTMVSDGELFSFVRGVVVSVIDAAKAEEIMAEPIGVQSAGVIESSQAGPTAL